MLGRNLLLHLLFASALAYNQELLSCLNGIGNDDLSDVVDVIANCTLELGNLTGTTCNDFQLKIEYDHCVFKGMRWTNENETEKENKYLSIKKNWFKFKGDKRKLLTILIFLLIFVTLYYL